MLFNKRKKEEEQRRAELAQREQQRQQMELQLQREREQREREEALKEAQKPVSPYKFSRPDPWPKELASVLREMLKKLFPDAKKAYLVSAEYEDKSGYLLVVDIEARYLKIINIYLDGETKRVRGDKPIECILYSKSGALTEGILPFYEKAENSATAMGTKESEYVLRSALDDVKNDYNIDFEPYNMQESEEKNVESEDVSEEIISESEETYEESDFVEEMEASTEASETKEEIVETLHQETVETDDEEIISKETNHQEEQETEEISGDNQRLQGSFEATEEMQENEDNLDGVKEVPDAIEEVDETEVVEVAEEAQKIEETQEAQETEEFAQKEESGDPPAVKVVPETKQQLFALMQRAGSNDDEEIQSIAYAGFGEFKFYIPYETEEAFDEIEEKETFPESSRLVMLINKDNGIKAIPFFTDKDDVVSFAKDKNCGFAYMRYTDYKTVAHGETIVSPAAEGIIINPGSEQILLPPDYPLL